MVNLHNRWYLAPLQNKLRDTITLLKPLGTTVQTTHENLDLSCIIWINHTSQNVYTVLHGQPRSRGYTSVDSLRHLARYPSRDTYMVETVKIKIN